MQHDESVATPPPNHLTTQPPTRFPTWLGALLVMPVAVLAAGLHLPHQTLWIDECTQFSGLSLGPVEVTRWLTDPTTHDFGLPGDRMPPLSYWLGWLWAQVFGLTEPSLRWFGVVCVAGATGLIFAAGRRAFGLLPGFAAALFFATAANVVFFAVEVRAYPLFLCTAAGAWWAWLPLVNRVDTPPPRQWAVLAAWLLAAIGTHFFGVVLAGALLTVSLAERRLRRARVRPVVVTAAVVGVLSIGLLPFVKGSETLSAPTLRGLAERAREVVQMLYHQVGQSALAVYHVDLLALAAAAVLAVGAMRAWPAERARARCLLAALALGLGVSAAANFVTHGFSPAQARYSLWALPGVALFLAAALNRRTGWVAAAAVTLLAAQLFAVYQFTAHGDYFAHGPHRRLTEVIDRGDLATTAVLHDDGDFGFIYYPLRYAYGGRLAQFGPGEPARPLPTAPAEREQALAGFRRLVVVRATKQHAPDLARQITQGDDRPGPVPLAAELTATGRWREAEVHRFVAMVAADVVVLER